MASELALMVRRHGGEPWCVPAVREVPAVDDEVLAAFIEDVRVGRIGVVVFQTGVGAAALLKEAERLGAGRALGEGLRRSTNVCRGPKPAGVLVRHGLPISVRVPEPHTTAELLGALERRLAPGHAIGLLHYGERNAPLSEALRARGAIVEELSLYEWRPPDDLEELRRLVRAAVAGGLDAIAFTSQIQARHFVAVAEGLGLRDALRRALATRTVVAAVGPTCAAALASLGIPPHVVPETPKMAPLVAALSAWLDRPEPARAAAAAETGGS
jgi:uroporphyrinogen-III synthase